MNEAELGLLFAPGTLALIDDLGPIDSADAVAAGIARLRRAGHPADVVAVAMTQARLRTKAVAKFGAFAERMLFTADGLQQATRLSVAARHAARFANAGLTCVADLGCGIGADALATAGLGLRVLAVEQDPVTAAIAQYNLAALPDAEVRIGDAEATDLDGVDGVWLDPARRPGAGGRSSGADQGGGGAHRRERHTTRRGQGACRGGNGGPVRLRPEDWSPSLDFAFGLGDRIATGVKLGPGMDRELIPDDAEAQWVSVAGDVVELVVWRGDVARPGVRRAALVLGAEPDDTVELTAADDAPDAEPGPLGHVLIEPDGAVIRARLIGALARRLDPDARMLDPTIAWITTDEQPDPAALSGLGHAFEVVAELPLDAKSIRRELIARDIGALEIKKRGVDLDPAEFRNALRLDPRATRRGTGPGSPVLIATRIAGRRRAILATRLS